MEAFPPKVEGFSALVEGMYAFLYTMHEKKILFVLYTWIFCTEPGGKASKASTPSEKPTLLQGWQHPLRPNCPKY